MEFRSVYHGYFYYFWFLGGRSTREKTKNFYPFSVHLQPFGCCCIQVPSYSCPKSRYLDVSTTTYSFLIGDGMESQFFLHYSLCKRLNFSFRAHQKSRGVPMGFDRHDGENPEYGPYKLQKTKFKKVRTSPNSVYQFRLGDVLTFLNFVFYSLYGLYSDLEILLREHAVWFF